MWLTATLLTPAEELTRWGAQKYVEYQPGTLPIIISAPHGGRLRPDGLPDRKFGRIAQDSNTLELARMIAEEMFIRYKGRPHLILCHMHRLKVDCNREIKEAAQGDPVATQIWKDYHGFIGEAKASVLSAHDGCLYIDLHGHRHPEGRVELGYLLTGAELSQSPVVLAKAAEMTSIRDLGLRTPKGFLDLLRGESSLGAMLEQRGYPSVPSPTTPAPGPGEDYFNGGYNTASHGSRDRGRVNGIQIECPFKGVRDKPTNHRRFAIALAEILGLYWKTHYQTELKPSAAKDD
jgi:hypothetical protein